MSKNTIDLREAIAKIMTDYGVDFYEGNLMHRHDQRLALIKDFQDQILLLISNREKLARLERGIYELERLSHIPQMFGDWESVIDDRINTLRKELGREEPTHE